MLGTRLGLLNKHKRGGVNRLNNIKRRITHLAKIEASYVRLGYRLACIKDLHSSKGGG